MSEVASARPPPPPPPPVLPLKWTQNDFVGLQLQISFKQPFLRGSANFHHPGSGRTSKDVAPGVPDYPGGGGCLKSSIPLPVDVDLGSSICLADLVVGGP